MTIARVGDAHQREMEQRVVQSTLNQQRMSLGNTLVQQAFWTAPTMPSGPHLSPKWL